MKYILVLCLALLTGCATNRAHITLNYEPMSEVTKVSQTVPLAVQVTDIRNEKDKVGCKKNGFGMEMANIVSENDVKDLVQQALCSELTNRGFPIGSENESSINVGVELGKFYNNFEVGLFSADAVSEVIFNVQVKKSDGTSSFSKTIIGKGVNEHVMLMGGDNAKDALESALKDAMTQLFNKKEFLEAISL